MTEYKKWQTQLNKGYLELCILVLLQNKKLHGALIKEKLSQANVNINEGTLYPLLNRMHDSGYLSSHWQPPENNKGHAIRLYFTNPSGDKLRQEILSLYRNNHDSLQILLDAKGIDNE